MQTPEHCIKFGQRALIKLAGQIEEKGDRLFLVLDGTAHEIQQKPRPDPGWIWIREDLPAAFSAGSDPSIKKIVPGRFSSGTFREPRGPKVSSQVFPRNINDIQCRPRDRLPAVLPHP